MKKDSRIFIAGHNGLLGSALFAALKKNGYKNLITADRALMDLTSQITVNKFFTRQRPDYVFLAAARVGGIYANRSYPAQFFYDNIMIQSNVINAAYVFKAKKILFYGSACSYPRNAEQPVKEAALLTGLPEPTNEAYAIAKIAGIKMCKFYRSQYNANFICAMPANMYGPSDNFDIENSHVIPALIRRFHYAKIQNDGSVSIWGTGRPKREFIFVDDAADASIFLMKIYNDAGIINLGTGYDISIRELADMIKETVRFKGKIIFDKSRPDGAPRKLLDSSRLKKLGWKAKTPLTEGIQRTYNYFLTLKKDCVKAKRRGQFL